VAYEILFFLFIKKGCFILIEIGELLRSTRESAGVSLEEASSDLDIKTIMLENIENGNIGCFKDIFVLKEDLANYSKYLGLDSKKIIDDFNEYLFEYTSKIPVSDIEKAMLVKQKEEKKEVKKEEKVVSPYTTPQKKKKIVIIGYIVVALLVLALIIWAVTKITINNSTTNTVSYVN